jgi:2-amino-4-hydroxy-6-hydroxymethyldihydropteridine diphosphokinase
MSKTAYLGIGSNLGSPLENCQRSFALMGGHPKIEVIGRSSFYETEPVGPRNQNWFINAVAEVSTDLEPLPLLEALLEIESAMGRVRNEKWGPRLIDLDILLYENKIVKDKRLEIPHPEMLHRNFVLAPLTELSPDLVHPIENKTIQQLLSEMPGDKKVVRLKC